MRRLLSHNTRAGMAVSARRAGVTLVEVLVAIFIVGIGLLALLQLFPLGALEMAKAVKDDRTAAVAANAIALSQVGEDLLARTAEFVTVSLSNGSADPKIAAALREEYEDLAEQSAEMEAQLQELQSLYPRPKIQRHLAQLLAQIRMIKVRIDIIIKLLSLLQNG